MARTSRPSGTTTILSPRTVGGLNRARVLRALVDHGPQSRSDLARLAGVTRATIGSIVQGLLDDGVLEELEPAGLGMVGKPARPLWFPPGAGSVAAVEVRGRVVRAALVDAAGTVSLDHAVELRDPAAPEAVLAAVLAAIGPVVADRRPIGVGIAVPGTCDPASGTVVGSAQVPGAVGTELVPRAADETRLPVLVENDSRAQALAELWFGGGRGVGDFTSMQTGDGLGVGLVLGGTVLRGPGGGAGEVGHTAVVLDGDRCVCGLRGCWETVATLRWLRREARALGLRGARTIDCRRLAELAGTERSAADLLARYADNLAVGIANLQQVLGAQHVILHGDAVGGGEAFRARVEQSARARSLGPVDVELTRLGADATLLGAAAVVLADRLHVG